jgi:hypothetical protein
MPQPSTHRPIPPSSTRLGAALVVPLLSTVCLGACQLERLFPKDVANGAARLTVLNAGVLAKLIQDDTGCGFSSEAGINTYTVDGETGGIGVVTWTIDDCVIDFGKPRVISTDCNDVTRTVGGKVTVSARRTVKGVLTGDPTTPVVPLTNDAATMQYVAQLDGFSVVQSSSPNQATMHQGQLTFDAEIHLAVTASQGVCAFDTAEVTLRDVTVTDAVYTITSADRVFEVDVPTMKVNAQLGEWQGTENFIAGTATVWDTVVDVGADPVLDPAYDREEFRASYACRDDLQLPQSYECPDLSETLANGATRLLLNDVGNVMQAVVNDTTCGFASPAVLASARVSGAVGYDGGDALYTIAEPCVIDVPVATVLSSDCQGDQVTGLGKATVTGSMRQRGRLTGDASQPVIPTSRDAVEIIFDISFAGWSVSGAGGQTFIATSGGVTGQMKPRLAKDSATGACSLPTPVVEFPELVIKPGTAGFLVNNGLSIGVAFQQGSISAQVGDKDGHENHLAGDVVVDVLDARGLAVDVSGPLDPSYDHDDALASFACTPNLVLPASDEDCSFDPVIAANAARLTIQAAGTLASMINADDACGFEDTLGVLLFPSEVVGDTGDLGSMSWDITDCAINHPGVDVLATDCSGGATFVEGNASFVNVGRTVRGERNALFFLVDSVIPRDRNAVDLDLRTVELNEFATYAIAGDSDEPDGVLVIHRGTLSAVVQPALGNRRDEPDTFDVPTPVARLSSVRLTATASLYAQGKTFHFEVNNAELLATNGPFLGAENTLSGTMVVNSKAYDLGSLALNPAYSATAFDDAYTCTENLAGPVR